MPPSTTTFLRLARATVLAAAALVVACKYDVTTPSGLVPHDANKALVGAVDGVYTFTIDPDDRKADTVQFGKSYVVIPPSAICDIGASGYGPSTWDKPCRHETQNITVTAIVRGASTTNPSIQFEPALRFNPASNVYLYVYVTDAATLSSMTVMKYCSSNALSSCVDESKSDPDLKTTIDARKDLVWRRIKHFSGYLIAE